MELLVWIIIFCLVGGMLSIIAASSFLLINNDIRTRLIPHLVSFAIGALLGAAFLGLLPHAFEAAGPDGVHGLSLAVLLGLLGFFVLEKMVIWRHCHAEHCEAHGAEHQVQHEAAGTLVLFGDAMHNFLDGILIAGAFLTDIHLGIVTSVAVAAHEIPQELGDFAILLHSGYSRTKALVYNLLASLATVVGGVVAYYALQSIQSFLPYILAVAASSFIYIAVADLIPGLHKKVAMHETIMQLTLIGSGVAVIYVSHSLMHS